MQTHLKSGLHASIGQGPSRKQMAPSDPTKVEEDSSKKDSLQNYGLGSMEPQELMQELV